jgi:hypothetical protein
MKKSGKYISFCTYSDIRTMGRSAKMGPTKEEIDDALLWVESYEGLKIPIAERNAAIIAEAYRIVNIQLELVQRQYNELSKACAEVDPLSAFHTPMLIRHECEREEL